MNNETYFIDPARNDMFSHLKGLDLQELIVQIENFYLIYRDTLNFPDNVSFGIEIEYEWLPKFFVDMYINAKHKNKWKSKTEDTVKAGGEIVSPKLYDKKDDWLSLKKVCKYLKTMSVSSSDKAGGHIHIGAHILGEDIDAWRIFLKEYAIYENILFRFVYNDKINGRKSMAEYAPPILEMLYANLERFDNFNSVQEFKKIYTFWERELKSLNFKNVKFDEIYKTNIKNTLEFRAPNSTFEEVIWQNNINTFVKMILSSKNDTIDKEFLDYKLKNKEVSCMYDFYRYNEVDLKNALEFVDLIFDNNLDKVYFLRQYLKNFENNYKLKSIVMAKKFVR